MEEMIKQSKDYQLQSLISKFTRFRQECTTNTEEEILMTAIDLAKKELKSRNIEIKN